MADIINAYRGTETKGFDRDTWNQLPADKYGWRQQSEEPEEVTALKQSVAGTEEQTVLPVSNESTQLGNSGLPPVKAAPKKGTKAKK